MPIRKPDEDLFEESKMSFGEHLEELRKVFMKALIGIALCCTVGFYFADQVVDFLTVPLDRALKKFNQGEAVKDIEDKVGYLGPELKPWLDDGLSPKQLLWDPGQFVKMVRKLSPDFLGEIDLTPYRFVTDNFDRAKIPDLCKEFSEQSGSSVAIQDRQKFLWSKLSAPDQATIKLLAEADEVSDSQFGNFLSVMNRLADVPDMASDEVFRELMVKPPSSIWDNFKEKVDDALPNMYQTYKDDPEPNLNRRLNRVLITRQFKDKCNALRLDLFAMEVWEDDRVGPQSLTATEPFMIWVKAGVVSGLLLASPWIFFQIWTFVAAGLYGHERKYVYLYMPISLGLFFAGVILAFAFVFEPVLDFLFSFNSQMGIAPIPRLTDWLSFVLFLPIGFGLAFQLPLLMLFLNRIGIFQINDYLTKWRVAVMVIFFLSMLLTPADPISMVLLAVPLTILYFLGIAMCKWMPQGKNPFDHVPES